MSGYNSFLQAFSFLINNPRVWDLGPDFPFLYVFFDRTHSQKKPSGYSVTELIYYFTPVPCLLSVLVCACGFWKPVECLGKTRTVGVGGVGAGRFNFAEFRSRSFAFVPLHLPFVYFKVRKRRWEKATFSPL